MPDPKNPAPAPDLMAALRETVEDAAKRRSAVSDTRPDSLSGWVPPSEAMVELAQQLRRDPRFVADPTLNEMLAKHRVPAEQHERIGEAVGEWLLSWIGNLANAVGRTPASQHALDVIQDETIRQLAGRARGDR